MRLLKDFAAWLIRARFRDSHSSMALLPMAPMLPSSSTDAAARNLRMVDSGRFNVSREIFALVSEFISVFICYCVQTLDSLVILCKPFHEFESSLNIK